VALLLAACGGESTHEDATSGGSGGGGAVAATGGDGGSVAATGGDNGSGGSPAGDGGTTTAGTGGSSGASGGDSSVGGSTAGAMPCAKVECPNIPTSCKQLVQDPNECCPMCLDTGCGACPDIMCADGTHSETVAGDCCPSCVADPPDACAMGQMTYTGLRMALLDKYGSSGCSNSADCTLVLENNACNVSCGVALPNATATNFADNLAKLAPGCASCPAPATADCGPVLASCVNGRCMAVDHTTTR
jgi:hypothetical protein